MPGADRSGAPVLVQHYDQIRQFGLDVQLTVGSWLFKLEAIQRAGARNLLGMEKDYGASVFGGRRLDRHQKLWGISLVRSGGSQPRLQHCPPRDVYH